MMYKLTGNPILHPHQIMILKLFFNTPFARTFYLTGGTALAAFYLAHRESQDLDFFSHVPFDTLILRTTMAEIAKQTGSEVKMYQRSQTYNEIFLENTKDKWQQKIDLVQEQPKHFGEILQIGKIRIDSLLNISTNKILAVFGRLEPKDYLDLYVICTRTDLSIEKLFKMAKEKVS